MSQETTGQAGDGGMIECSILVPVLNEQDYVSASVAAMRKLQLAGELEILVVDGGSTDETVSVLRRLAAEDSRIRLLENPRRVIPAGLNIALRHARGRWIARMDAHSEYPIDYLERGVARIKLGGTRWVSGPQIALGRGAVGRATALALKTRLGRGGSRRWATADAAPDHEYELDSGVFCGVWPREALLEYGGWDERWPRNEDSELAARFQEHGERLICLPAMAATYRPRESLRSLWRQYADNGFFRARTARHHPHTLRRSNLLPPVVVLAAACSVGRPSPIRTLARALLATYAAALMAASVRALPESENQRDALFVAPVLAVMHIGYGAGFLRGIWQHGVPVAALAYAAGVTDRPPQLAAKAEEVFAPSLNPIRADRVGDPPAKS